MSVAAITNVFLLLLLLLFTQSGQCGVLLEMLDGMMQLNEGSGQFDRVFYNELIVCFDEMDQKLMDSQDAQWAGMVEYANVGGNQETGDVYHRCTQEQRWFEHNCTTQDYESIPIHEPCNYASNIAYYHTAMEVCKHTGWNFPPEYVKAIFRSFAVLTQGSAFWHGSQTSLGGGADVRTNDLFTYVIHQAAIQSLKPLDSTIIHELSFTPREKSGIQITEDLLDVFLTQPVNDWESIICGLDMPRIEMGWCAFLTTLGALALEEETLNVIIEWAFENIPVLTDEMYEMCIDNYLPLVRNATVDIQLTEIEKNRILHHTEGMVIKLVYALVWQEQAIIPGFENITFSPEANEMGWAMLPAVNDFANILMNYEYYDPNLQHGINIYPGELWCNPANLPHAKWHLQTGIALTDMVFLADEVHEILTRGQRERKMKEILS